MKRDTVVSATRTPCVALSHDSGVSTASSGQNTNTTWKYITNTSTRERWNDWRPQQKCVIWWVQTQTHPERLADNTLQKSSQWWMGLITNVRNETKKNWNWIYLNHKKDCKYYHAKKNEYLYLLPTHMITHNLMCHICRVTKEFLFCLLIVNVFLMFLLKNYLIHRLIKSKIYEFLQILIIIKNWHMSQVETKIYRKQTYNVYL